MQENKEGNALNILRELSDLKVALTTNTVETSNIKKMVDEIRGDMKDIKNDFITRRELDETLRLLKEEISPLRKIVYGFVALVLTAFVGGLIALVYK